MQRGTFRYGLRLGAGLMIAGFTAAPLAAQTATAAPLSQSEADALRAEVARLRAELAAVSARLDAALPAPVAPAPVVVAAATPAPATPVVPPVTTEFRGAPRFASGDGWSFKPRGRIHFDVGNVSIPGALSSTRNLGTAARFRRIRLGAEGTIPGGFGYKVDVDFANSAISFGDAYLSYDVADNLELRAGNLEPLDGLDQISSSNYISFLERASFNDAFLNSRRLGAALAYDTAAGLRAEAGLFAAHSIDGSFDNDGYIIAARLSYSPEALGGRIHVGLNAQYRNFASNNAGAVTAGANQPSTGQLARYRARPNSQLTDVRFVDTGGFAARGDSIIGIEAAAIFPGWYVAGEAQWLTARAYRPGSVLGGLDSFGAGNSAVVTTSNPQMFGAYGEIGWFITGETRGFRDSVWARTRVLNPVSRGGSGAFQLAARIDHIDLSDAALQAGLTNDFTGGTGVLAGDATRLGRGGIQTAYLIAFNWYPGDYVRFMLNYGRITVDGGPLAAQVDPLSGAPVDQRDYATDVLAARLQLDF